MPLLLNKYFKNFKDFDSSVLPCLKPDQPCYLLYKLDSKHFDGSPEWLLTTYVPENTPVSRATSDVTLLLFFRSV